MQNKTKVKNLDEKLQGYVLAVLRTEDYDEQLDYLNYYHRETMEERARNYIVIEAYRLYMEQYLEDAFIQSVRENGLETMLSYFKKAISHKVDLAGSLYELSHSPAGASYLMDEIEEHYEMSIDSETDAIFKKLTEQVDALNLDL